MSTEDMSRSHLSQSPLEGNDEAILATLSTWLSTARFEKQGPGWELCMDEELPEKSKMLPNMNLSERVCRFVAKSLNQLTPCQLNIIKYSIIRIPGPKVSHLKNPEGPFYMTPIRILPSSPTAGSEPLSNPKVDGHPLSIKNTTYVGQNKSITIEPALDVLFTMVKE